jgi:Fur family transcriptional regulator, peroxide stress response regulator
MISGTITDMRRNSKQRQLILEILRNTKTHPTADAIYEEVRKTISRVSKGTVYRNLNVLLEGGEIRELNLDGAISRFDARVGSHYHFRCNKCDRVIDLELPVAVEMETEVARKTGFKVSSHRIEFCGLCTNCQ